MTKTNDELIEEFKTKFPDPIAEKYGQGVALYCSFCAGQKPISDWLRTILTQKDAEIQKAREEERERIVAEVLYEVDVDKQPTIQDEAYANMFDSKVEAFWYGEAKAIQNIREALTNNTK